MRAQFGFENPEVVGQAQLKIEVTVVDGADFPHQVPAVVVASWRA
jgi:hypothetical protein